MVIFSIIIMLLVLLEEGYRKDDKYVCIVRFGSQITRHMHKEYVRFGDFRGCLKFVNKL